LRGQYFPESYARHGTAARVLAGQILALLEQAYAQLRTPSQVMAAARETLPRSVDRRFAEGLAHRDAGRLAEALRAFESVLALDRHHVAALDELRALRARLEPAPR